MAFIGPALDLAAHVTGLALGGGASHNPNNRDKIIDRAQSSDDSRNSSTARSAVGATAYQRVKCQQCPPDCGQPSVMSTRGWSPDSITYQQRIAQSIVEGEFITEWRFRGVDFDGFVSAECLLKEAKARYDQFIDAETLKPKVYWKGTGRILKEAESQDIVTPEPQISLRWYWMEPLSYAYFSSLIKPLAPKILHIHEP